MINIFIDLNNGYSTMVENSTLDDFEFIKKEIKNPFVSVICLANTVIVKKYITRVYYTKKDGNCGKNTRCN